MTTNGRRLGLEPKDEELAGAKSDAPDDKSPSGVFPVKSGSRKLRGWTITEQFESKGFHYCVLRRPVEGAACSSPQLTKREADAVALAAAGHTNKSIASELDVSPSTVGVLLFRAAAKLGAKSRADLVAAYQRLRGV